MRFPEDAIKKAVLHPEPEVRLIALQYFAESGTADASIMPMVIQAVQRYGMPDSFALLRSADSLPQSAATIGWLIEQLRRPFDTEDVEQDNLRFALALILLEADPQLLARRHNNIVSLAALPEELKAALHESMKLEFSSWPSLWVSYEQLGRGTMANEGATRAEARRLGRIIRAMARHRSEGAEQVMSLLRRQCPSGEEALRVWLEPSLVELAGRMRLEAAVPLLLDRLAEDCEAVNDEIGVALARIGGNAVIEALSEKWPCAKVDHRMSLVEPLEYIHTELALQQVLLFLPQEKDTALRFILGHAALGQFTTESIEPVRRLLLEDEDSGDYWDLRYRLVATATIMGERFPEYGAWHQEAVATNYGLEKIKGRAAPVWLADAFSDDEEQPRRVHQIEIHSRSVYQLKVTLKGIKPPIWRRLLVPDCSLDDLHAIIQVAMAWENYHLYAFHIGNMEFTNPDMHEGELDMDDACSTALNEVIANEKQKFIYQYDFGDDWRHEITVEKIQQVQSDRRLPICLAGKRACPPEDVGGTWGYAEYLQALADFGHEQHAEFLAWRGQFNPEAFDLEAVNRMLRKAFW